MSRSRLNIATRGLALAAVLLVTTRALAGDVFYSVKISDLKLTEGELPADQARERVYRLGDWFNPRVVLDGDGEAYLRPLDEDRSIDYASMSPARAGLAIRGAANRKISGTLYWPNRDWSGLVKLRFAVEAAPSDEAKSQFTKAKELYYSDLLSRGVAGGAWFRHQLRELHGGAGSLAQRSPQDARNWARTGTIDDTFDLFSGGRAISENLQLDRALLCADNGGGGVSLDSLKGITVAEIDWKPLIKDMQPATDPLAKLVPADQHLILFPNFPALAAVGDRLAQQGSVVLGLAQPRTSDALLVARYERQLGISLGDLAKLAGSAAGSVALTGSDP